MSPPIPTTNDLKDGLVAAISASINQTIPFLPKTFVRVLSQVLAAVLVVLYKFASFVFLQIFVVTASFKETTINGVKIRPLVFWGRLIGLGDPDPATKAELLIDITVELQSGDALIAGETNVIGSLNGYTYSLQANVFLNAPVVQGAFRAVADPLGNGGAGAAGNLSAGDIVSFATPNGDVAPDAVVQARTADGADAESEESYRGQVVDWFGGRPQGGAGLDYVYWGRVVEGIINVYPYTGDPGEVDTYSEATPASSGDPDGIPTAAQLIEVGEAIQNDVGGLALNRPVGSFVNVYPISRTGFTVDITDLSGEDLPTLKTNIGAALEIHLLEREPYIDGVTSLPRKQNITLDNIRGIVNDFAEAANGSFTSVVLRYTVSGTAFDVYTLAEGEKAKLTIVNYLTS